MEKQKNSDDQAIFHYGTAELSARTIAGLIAFFSLLNIMFAGNIMNIWWIDMRFLHPVLAWFLVLAGGILFGAFAILGSRRARLRWCTLSVSLVYLAVAAANCINYYLLLAGGIITTSFPVPFSILVTFAMLLVAAVTILKPRRKKPLRRPLSKAIVLLVIMCVITPFAQMYCFGKTDYRRPADAIVVFGAGVHADGSLSIALADRMKTAVELYRNGLAETLIVSGGPGTGQVHETEAMAGFAASCGVDPDDIIPDAQGVNTRNTIKNTERILSGIKARRVMAVSHAYHLPRIKMTYQQAGMDVYTVPARESYFLNRMPYYMAREAIALWAYYLFLS